MLTKENYYHITDEKLYHKIIEKGMLVKDYNEDIVAEYMREKNIEIYVEIGTGKERFKVYTTDLTKKYIEINSDYRT